MRLVVALLIVVGFLAGCSKQEQEAPSLVSTNEVVVSERKASATPSPVVEGAPVHLQSNTRREWQNGPSEEALSQGSYGKKPEKRVSGKPSQDGGNVPVLLEIPTESSTTPFRHGLDP